MRLLLVEDDSSLGATLVSWLQLDGYAVDWVRRGDEGQAALATHDYDALLLDRGLPGLAGDALLSALRARRMALPVLLLTARDTLQDRVEGLDLGADDYLVKPFDLEELSARLRAALRRGAQRAAPTWRHGALELDPAARRVTLDGQPVALTAREFAVLQALMRRPGHVVSRGELEASLYGWGDEVDSNAIEVHIYHLRKKLGSQMIQTTRNLGYGLRTP